MYPQLAAQPTAYLAPNPVAGTGEDATMDFQAALNDPTRWVVKSSVPIFKQHERKDPATGNMIRVDLPKLYRIANNMQQMERGGVPVRLTLGHTEPTKPENEQPPVGGYYRNARVQPFGPKGEPAVVMDEWLDPQYAQKRKNFPYRSAEYYDDAEQITGVALLTRDPYLDLGVVAYSRGHTPINCSASNGLISHTSSTPLPVNYARNPVTGRAPVMYRLTLGELPMFPQGLPPTGAQPQPTPQAPQPQPQYMNAALPPQYAAPQPGPYAAPIPTQYAAPPANYGGPWPGPAYHQSPAAMPHSNEWRYERPPQGRGRPYAYADGPPGGPPMMEGPGGGGGGGNPLEAALEGLSMAAEAIQAYMESQSAAPQEPFPPGAGPDGGPMPPGGAGPTMAARYGRPGGYRPRPGQQRPRSPQYARYDRAGGASAAPGAVTISGLPVGYQMRLDQIQYENKDLKQAMQVLMYERDQADTAECVAEVRRLAADGFPVGEYEVAELKKLPRAHRMGYLEHISTKYAKVPTSMPPVMPGDPTPGPVEAGSGPMTREMMDAALNVAANNPNDPNAYMKAVQYMRSGGPVQYGAGPAVGPNGDWLPGSFPDPNAFEPSLNGNARY